jgi:predicted dehydrogenase
MGGKIMELFENLELSDKRVRAVLVGCGEHATLVMNDAISFLDEVDVVGVCDLNEQRANFAARRFRLDRSWQNIDEMLEKVEADVALVVTVPRLQALLTQKCVEAGLHVYTEKPISTELDDAYSLMEAAKRMKRKVGVAFNKRYALAYQNMKKAIDSDEFGKPGAFIAKFIAGYRNTQTDLLRVGAIHFFDLGRFLIDEIDEVYAYKFEQAMGQHIFAVSAQFNNKCVGSFTLGSTGSWINGYGMETLEVRGDRNMLYVDNGRNFTYQKPAKITGQRSSGTGNTQAVTESQMPAEISRPNYSNMGKFYMRDFYINGNYQGMKEFVKSVINDTEPHITVHDGLMALKIAIAIEKSVDEKRAVKINEIK